MKSVSKKSPDSCPLCGQYMDVLCSGFRHQPFVDGRCYEYICHTCFCVPCTARFDEDAWMWHRYDFEDGELHTIEELMGYGFDKKEATVSIKAVKAAIKKHK